MKDFSSTMDVVMTPEERAEMEAAAKDAEAKVDNPTAASVSSAAAAGDASTPPLAEATASPTPVQATVPPAAAAEASTADHNGHLAHHSSFSGGSRPSSGQGSVGKPGTQTPDKKGKAKLSPEQKAKLEELEKKQEEQKQQR